MKFDATKVFACDDGPIKHLRFLPYCILRTPFPDSLFQNSHSNQHTELGF